jgi:hypothetical protein
MFFNIVLFQRLSVALITFLYVTPLAANIVWPALWVGGAIYSTWFLVIISIIIEALFFYVLLPNISVVKATIMSLIGNAVSVAIGTVAAGVAMVGWHALFDTILGGTFHPVNIVATWVLMWLGSALIELVALKIFFRYSWKQLLAPVLIGNFITYVVTMVYQFSHELEVFITSMRSHLGM